MLGVTAPQSQMPLSTLAQLDPTPFPAVMSALPVLLAGNVPPAMVLRTRLAPLATTQPATPQAARSVQLVPHAH